MKPYYQDEWVTIYHGDCLDLLSDIGPDHADVIMTNLENEVNSLLTLRILTDDRNFKRWRLEVMLLIIKEAELL